MALFSESNTNNDESWKSDGFLNLYLPTPSGGSRKVGSIGLKLSKAHEADLIKALQEGGDDAVNRLVGKLSATFVMADGSSSEGFDLS